MSLEQADDSPLIDAISTLRHPAEWRDRNLFLAVTCQFASCVLTLQGHTCVSTVSRKLVSLVRPAYRL